MAGQDAGSHVIVLAIFALMQIVKIILKGEAMIRPNEIDAEFCNVHVYTRLDNEGCCPTCQHEHQGDGDDD